MTSPRPSVRTSLPSLRNLPPIRLLFAPDAPTAKPRAWTTSSPAPAPALLLGGDDRDLPGSWTNPSAHTPRSSTPPDPLLQASTEQPILPSAQETTSAPDAVPSRGSFTRLARPLCTLRSRGRPRTTQHSVPAGGQPLPGRSLTYQVCYRRFPIC